MDIKRIVSPKRHLPAELIRDILLRLPVKSLLRFCCVSKSWLSLIKGPDFSRLHLQNLKKNNRDETHLLVVQGRSRNCVVRCSDTFETIAGPILSLGSRWRITCSVDGLFLLESEERYGINNSRTTNHLRIWNPSIRKFHDIPSLLGIDTSHDSFYLETRIGLGYDPLTKDYKYVKLVRESRDQPPLVAVYALGTGLWKIIPFQGKEVRNFVWDFMSFELPVYLRGNLYLIATHQEKGVSELVSFDVSNEVFCSISLPDDNVSDPLCEGYRAIVRNGCSSLALLHNYDGLAIWVLETESMCWTEKPYETHFVVPDFFYLKKNRDLLMWWYDQEAFFSLATDNNLKFTLVSSYNLESNTERILMIQEERDFGFECHQVYGYMESLVLLK